MDDDKKEKSLDERKVEALERIADRLDQIGGELSVIRNAQTGVEARVFGIR